MSAADSIEKIGSGAKGVAILVAAVAVVWVGWKVYQGGAAVAGAAKDIATKDLNPASDQNLAYRGVNSVIGCGDGSCSLGTRVYDGVQWFKDLFGTSSTPPPADPTAKLINDAASNPGLEYGGT